MSTATGIPLLCVSRSSSVNDSFWLFGTMCTWFLLFSSASAGSARQVSIPALSIQDNYWEKRSDPKLVTHVVFHRLLLTLTSSAAFKHASPTLDIGNSVQSSILPKQLDRRIHKWSVPRYGSMRTQVPHSAVMRLGSEPSPAEGNDLQLIAGAFCLVAVGYVVTELLYTINLDRPKAALNLKKPPSLEELVPTVDTAGPYNKNIRRQRPTETLSIRAIESFFDFLLWYQLANRVKGSQRYFGLKGAQSSDFLLELSTWFLQGDMSAEEVAAGPDVCAVSFAGLPAKKLSVADSNVPIKIAEACGILEEFRLVITVQSDKSFLPLGWLEAAVAQLPPPAYISLPDAGIPAFKNKNEDGRPPAAPEQGIILSNVLIVGLLGVDPSFLRRGVATLLMDWILRKAECWGAEGVALFCDVQNIPALRLYGKLGFDTVPSWLGVVENNVLLVKWL